jgi:hypothetical protein
MPLGQKKLNILFDMKKCTTEGCKNKAPHGKKLCWTCKSRRAKENNPLGYYYNLLRCNARRRKKEFALTLEDFKIFCKETEYDKLKGKKANCLSIDRIKFWEGYTKNNIRAISVSANVKRERGVLLDIDNEWQIEKEKCPF